jgi:DNA-binding transcriptional LysR family regulator
MNMELPIDLLQSFFSVAETGSFTRAGEARHITQSAISMQMKRLEGIVGQPLFRKQGRSFRLTAAGETLLEHVVRILSAHNDAVAAFSRPDLFGRVRFGCAEDFAARFLPSVLSGFRKCFPRIGVDIISAPGDELQIALQKKKLDLCLLEGAWEGGKVVHREPLVWVTSPTGRAHDQDPLPLAVYHDGCPYRRWAVEGLRKAKRRFWVAFVSPSITSILAAVKTGLAVAPIGASNMEDALRVLGPDNGFPLLPVSDVSLHQSTTAESETVACFANYVIDSFRRTDRRSPAIGFSAG